MKKITEETNLIPIYIDPKIGSMSQKETMLRHLIPRVTLIRPGNWFTKLFWKYIKLDTSRLDKKLSTDRDLFYSKDKKITALYKYIKESKNLNKSTILRKLTLVRK